MDNSLPELFEKALIYAFRFTFSILEIAFQRINDKNVLFYVHIFLAFLVCSSLISEVMKYIK
jgi:hypothetical protein